MLVRATREGFYAAQRRSPGQVFDMDKNAMKRNKVGEFVLPSWVEEANKPVEPVKQREPVQNSDDKGKQVI